MPPNVKGGAWSPAATGSPRHGPQQPGPTRSNESATPEISPMRGHFIASTGEFLGTFFFLWIAYSGQLMVLNQAPSTSSVQGGTISETVVFTSLIYGMSLLVNAWAFYRMSGGLFNPAVALGLSLGGRLPWKRTMFLVPAQILASMCAGGLVEAMFSGSVGDVNTILAPGTSTAQGFFIETFLTAQLTFVVLMLAAEKSKDTFLAPIGIGLALFAAELSGVYYTGGSLNPVRSFGCAVASRKFPTYHWIYWIAPCLGAALASGYYVLVRRAHYEQANPGQDSAGTDEGEPDTETV